MAGAGAAFLAAALVSAGAAQRGSGAAVPAANMAGHACGENHWPSTAEGAPRSLALPNAPGYYVWHDSRSWHLRARARPGTTLSARVVADAPVRVLATSPASRIVVGSRLLAFDLKATRAAVRVDLGASCAASLVFRLGVGAQAGLPASPPVFLGSRGAAPAPSFEVRRPAATGVYGSILVGPTCPVVGPSGCGPPKHVRGSVRVETVPPSKGVGAGRLVTTVESDAEGNFSVDLAPGRYSLIVVKKEQGFPVARPTLVDVEAGVVSGVTLVLDTGIR